MTTPTPEGDPLTERFEPVHPSPVVAPPAAPSPGGAPPASPSSPPMFVAPEPGPVPTQPLRPTAAAAGAAGPGTASRRPVASARVLNAVLAVAVLIAVAGIAFSVGRTTAASSGSPVANAGQGDDGGGGNGAFGNGNGAFGNGNGPFGNGNGPLGGNGPNASLDPNGGDVDGGRDGARAFGRFGALGIQGTVQSVTANSVTIRLANGAVVTVGTDASTTYHQQASASASDVQPGRTVIVNLAGGFRPGQANGGNGSITLGNAGAITVVP